MQWNYHRRAPTHGALTRCGFETILEPKRLCLNDPRFGVANLFVISIFPLVLGEMSGVFFR